MSIIKVFVATIITVFILDMCWLGFIARNLYAVQLGSLLRQSGGSLSPIWSSAILVYVAIATGIVCFVLPKVGSSYAVALFWGGVFGAVTYGIYDFTNHAILNNWPLKITLIDFCWGIILCALSSVIATFFKNTFAA